MPMPRRLQVADDREQPMHVLGAKRRGRLVEHDEPHVPPDGVGDLDQALAGVAQVADRLVHGQVESEFVQDPCGLGRQVPPVQRAGQPTRGLVAEQDVLGHREVRQDAEFLEDDADAEGEGLAGVGRPGLGAGEDDAAGVIGEPARQHVHEGGLAGPVLADQGVDLAGADLKVDPVQGADARKVLDDVFHPKEGLGRFHRTLSGKRPAPRKRVGEHGPALQAVPQSGRPSLAVCGLRPAALAAQARRRTRTPVRRGASWRAPLRVAARGLPSVLVKDLFHRVPPLALRAGGDGLLTRFAEIPPFLGGGVGSHFGHVSLEVVARVLEVGE